MPLQPGKSKAVQEQNFHEFRHGKTFKRTAAKFGKANAVKQMEEEVLGKARQRSSPKSGLSTKLGRPAPSGGPGIGEFHSRSLPYPQSR